MLVYRKKAMSLDEFSIMLEYLHAVNSADIIAGDFNYDLSKASSIKLLQHAIRYTHVFRW